jgi:hypothetical protein
MRDDCDHFAGKVYARKTFANGTVHTCVQCIRCLAVVRLPEHNMRPWIRLDEVPLGRVVHAFIEEGQAQ